MGTMIFILKIYSHGTLVQEAAFSTPDKAQAAATVVRKEPGSLFLHQVIIGMNLDPELDSGENKPGEEGA